MRTLPMFPLGTPLLPGAPLALRIFEPRYVALVEDIVAGRVEPKFGVVLIARGSEVGGTDERTNVGTIAHLVELGELPGNRFGMRCVGGERIRVERWLPDDPYPTADIRTWPDQLDGTTDDSPIREQLVELYGLATQLAKRQGRNAPTADPLAGLPAAATPRSYALAYRAGLSEADLQSVLTAPGPVARLAVLATALEDRITALRFVLS